MSQNTVASAEDERSFIRQMAPRMILLALMCVVVQGLMGLSYMGAFGKPEAKRAPFIVASTTEGNAGYIANKLNAVDGQPVIATISTNEKDAIEQVKRDHAVGVYVFNPSKSEKNPKDDLYFASAQGASRVAIAQTVASKVAQEGKRGLVQHDVVPAAADDTRGTASFYLVLAWMVGAYLLPSAMTTAVGTRARSAIGARLRLGLFAGYAVLSGLVGTFIAQHMLDALHGSFWTVSLLGMGLVFAVSTFAYGLTSLLGTIGIGLSILLFVILGNPSAGGAFAYDVLPEPWRTVGPYLPNGAGVDAVRSLSYFGGVDLQRPLLVILVWGLVGLWIIWMVGNNTYRFSPTGTSMPEDEAVGALGEFVEHHLPHHRDQADAASHERGRHAAGRDDADTSGAGSTPWRAGRSDTERGGNDPDATVVEENGPAPRHGKHAADE